MESLIRITISGNKRDPLQVEAGAGGEEPRPRVQHGGGALDPGPLHLQPEEPRQHGLPRPPGPQARRRPRQDRLLLQILAGQSLFSYFEAI